MDFLPDHLTVVEFAIIKQVYPQTVYDHIERGIIEVDFVGKSKARLIDGAKYRDYTFPTRQKRKGKLDAYFKRIWPVQYKAVK